MSKPMLKPCEVCGKPVSSDARTCPHCGKPLPQNGLGGTGMATKFFYIAVCIIAIFFIARYLFS